MILKTYSLILIVLLFVILGCSMNNQIQYKVVKYNGEVNYCLERADVYSHIFCGFKYTNCSNGKDLLCQHVTKALCSDIEWSCSNSKVKRFDITKEDLK